MRELSEVQRDHPVVFLVVYDGQTDPDWHHTYSTVAQERGLLAKFVFTTKTDLVQVHIKPYTKVHDYLYCHSV